MDGSTAAWYAGNALTGYQFTQYLEISQYRHISVLGQIDIVMAMHDNQTFSDGNRKRCLETQALFWKLLLHSPAVHILQKVTSYFAVYYYAVLPPICINGTYRRFYNFALFLLLFFFFHFLSETRQQTKIKIGVRTNFTQKKLNCHRSIEVFWRVGVFYLI